MFAPCFLRTLFDQRNCMWIRNMFHLACYIIRDKGLYVSPSKFKRCSHETPFYCC